MLLLFFLFAEGELPGWVIPVIAAIAGSNVLTAIVTRWLAKPKDAAETAQILAQTNTVLATQLHAATTELRDVQVYIPRWKSAIQRQKERVEAAIEFKDSTSAAMKLIRVCLEAVNDSVAGLSFIQTSPGGEDERVANRLRTAKAEASNAIAIIDANLAIPPPILDFVTDAPDLSSGP